MPLDSEKKRLEGRLLHLLSQALQDRNRDHIVSTSLELGALYLSGDLYDKSEECYRRVLEDPVVDLARPEEKTRAECGVAQVALRRGHLTLARESLERAEKFVSPQHSVLLEVRLVQCQRGLQTASYREVIDTIEDTLSGENPEKLGDARVSFMVLEGQARALMGRNRDAKRLLEKALELAESTGYELGAATAHGELGVLLGATGDLKSALENLAEAERSAEGMGSQYRLDLGRQRSAAVLLRMGRWDEAAQKLESCFQSSRDLRTLDNRLSSQLLLAELKCLRGHLDDAQTQALDSMEVSRAAGFVRAHVEGLLLLGKIAFERDECEQAVEFLREAETLYSRVAAESSIMIQVHTMLGVVHGVLKKHDVAAERLIRAHNLSKESANEYELQRVDRFLGRHLHLKGDTKKAGEVYQRAAAALGSLGAKYDVGLTRLWYAQLLADKLPAKLHSEGPSHEDEQEIVRLARSNIFEARRLLEPMNATPRLAEIAAVEAKLPADPA